MIKILWPFLVGTMLLAGCQQQAEKPAQKPKSTETAIQTQSESNSNFAYPHLLSDVRGYYALLMIGDQDKGAPIEENKTIRKQVKSILSLPTLAQAQQVYPKLDIAENTAFVLFSDKDLVYRAKDINDLSAYLKEHPLKQ